MGSRGLFSLTLYAEVSPSDLPGVEQVYVREIWGRLGGSQGRGLEHKQVESEVD